MRPHGITTSASGYGPGDHLCWPFGGYDDFSREAMRFLAEGLALGERALYTADRPVDLLRDDVLTGIRDAATHLASGALVVESLLDTYDLSAVADPGAQVEQYVGLTRAAVADGYTGLRAAADVTLLVRDDAARDTFVCYEHLVDRAMLDVPFTAMCGYDRTRLAAGVADELACVHPHRRKGSSSFALWNDEHALVLTGEVDAAFDPHFGQALSRVLATVDDHSVRVDCSSLDYVDVRGLRALDEAARSARLVLHLVRPPRSAERLVELLDPVAVAIAGRR